MPDFRTFRVLPDEPAAYPAFGFDVYARTLADLVRQCAPRLAIGVFGEWGAGKTTLMEAIKRELASDPKIVCVWFNAWRYEREEHLIVPLLDTLREAIADVATTARAARDKAEEKRARQAAAKLAQAAKAISAGLVLKASVPLGGPAVEVDPGKMMAKWANEKRPIAEPVSFYHASYRKMNEAVAEFTAQGAHRIVIFVDDLDRCFPRNALQVLEGMKLFFGFDGLIFVVGLDQRMIKNVFAAKFQDEGAPPFAEGAEYMKKLFQVEFALPRIDGSHMESFFGILARTNDMPDEQAEHIRTVVWPHFANQVGRGLTINPRETKRLINSYTLQMKLMTESLPDANPDAVLAVQTIASRPDWRGLYDVLSIDPFLFQDWFQHVYAVESPLSLNGEPVPESFLDYLRGPGEALVRAPRLDAYISTAELIRSSDPSVLEALQLVVALQKDLAGAAVSKLGDERALLRKCFSMLSRVRELLAHRSFSSVFADVQEELSTLEATLIDAEATSMEERPWPPSWITDVPKRLLVLQELLRHMRRETLLSRASA